MVVQIAKHLLGAKTVVGLAGTSEKCRWVESLGADKCVNYKDSDWKDQVKKATPDLVDVFFDNVGGESLDATILSMNNWGRIGMKQVRGPQGFC